MIRVEDLPPAALSLRHLRARGPGGQHVNKSSTAVELRVDLNRCGLPRAVCDRLLELAGRRATTEREIVIFADESRSLAQNREAALARFATLLERAQQRQEPRIPTKPSRGAKQRRVEAKHRRGETKRLRRPPDID
ncbi:MAG: alternative ribosome rescue aminoacyl-tRNA hydrolase ArfB [Gammaproteobacteria bacterium]